MTPSRAPPRPALPRYAPPSAHEFHDAVLALDERSPQQRLLQQALLLLLHQKPDYYCGLSLQNLHALLAVCHVRTTCTARVARPAGLLAAVARDIELFFKVHDKHTLEADPELWRVLATGQDDHWREPAYSKAWFVPSAHIKEHVQVGGV